MFSCFIKCVCAHSTRRRGRHLSASTSEASLFVPSGGAKCPASSKRDKLARVGAVHVGGGLAVPQKAANSNIAPK